VATLGEFLRRSMQEIMLAVTPDFAASCRIESPQRWRMIFMRWLISEFILSVCESFRFYNRQIYNTRVLMSSPICVVEVVGLYGCGGILDAG
jgi:hypothetical protein